MDTVNLYFCDMPRTKFIRIAIGAGVALFILLLIIILATTLGGKGKHHDPYDYYVFEQSWPAATCQDESTCVPLKSWVITGLVAMRDDQVRSEANVDKCNGNITKDDFKYEESKLSELVKVWPAVWKNQTDPVTPTTTTKASPVTTTTTTTTTKPSTGKRFRRNTGTATDHTKLITNVYVPAWNEDGRCGDLKDYTDYFDKAQDLFKNYNVFEKLTKDSIVPSQIRHYTADKVLKALLKDNESLKHESISLRCHKAEGLEVAYLEQINICFKYEQEKFVPSRCEEGSNCEGSFAYLVPSISSV